MPYEKIGKNEPVCIADEVPFEIPDSWEWVRLGNIGDWGSGATPSRTKPEYYGGTIPWLKTGDLNDGYIDNIPERITELALSQTSVRLNPIGSVLIAMYGATIGKLGILKIPATTNQACCACIPYDGVFNEFLFYFLMSQKTAFIKQGEGGAQPNISKEKIISTLMPLPPTDEQMRIVMKLRRLQPFIEQYGAQEQYSRKLDMSFPNQLKKSILQYAVQGKLVPQDPSDEPASVLLNRIRAEKEQLIKAGKIKRDKHESVIVRRDNSFYEKVDGIEHCIDDEIPFEVPEGWEWCRLSQVTQAIGDIDHKMPTKIDGKGYPYISPLDFTDTGIDYDNAKQISEESFLSLSKKFLPQRNDIIFPRYGTIGVIRKIETDQKILVSYSCCVIKSLEPLVPTDFVYLVLSSPLTQQEINRYINKTTQPNVGLASIKRFLFPLPPMAEQQRIVEKLNHIFEKIK